MQRFLKTINFILLVSSSFFLNCCGNPGITTSASEAIIVRNITGSITSQAGNQGDMAGWNIVLVDQYGVSRGAEVDTSGLFGFSEVSSHLEYTLVLLSPSHVMQAVLSTPSDNPTSIKQFFKIESSILPRLIHKGPVITFQDTRGISMQNSLASDIDADTVPDGAQIFGLWGGVDVDLDGITENDPDIDGDGVINWFDSDDDGDGVLDLFDRDSNGDGIDDSQQQESDLYFSISKYIDFIAVKFEIVPKTDGSFERTITFAAKLLDNIQEIPQTIQIKGAPSLLSGSLVATTDTSGAQSFVEWDKILYDNGSSEDSSADDGLYARRVYLPADRSPIANQVLFFQLAFGDPSNPKLVLFPYMFPAITVKTITPSYEPITHTVALEGNPFGEIQDFVWVVSVFTPAETGSLLKVYSSTTIPGSTRSFTLPENITETGKTYKYKIVAQVLDRVAGYPAYVIESKTEDLTIVTD